MKRTKKVIAACLVAASLLTMTGCSGQKEEAQKTQKEKGFEAKLDTEKQVVLDVKGFFGNFEALDQVMADFNKYYPNVKYSYEQVGGTSMGDYLKSDSNIDIFMTSDDTINTTRDCLDEYYEDFSQSDIDFSTIDQKLLDAAKVDGKIVWIPMGQRTYGMVVNETLLEKEGLSVPETYEDFLHAMEVLKNKGYVPVQGPTSKVYAECTINMVMNMIENDETLYENLKKGDPAAVDTLMPVMDKLDQMIENGYIDEKVNVEYPEDNYDAAILRFFEGEVPFWICDTEKVSGMKKRETKSEAFIANPFDYSYVYTPMGDNGVYEYHEPWCGFSVSKKGENYEYAMELMRFLTRKEELNVLADVKGVPAVTVEKTDNQIYEKINNPSKVELSSYRDNKITYEMIGGWYEGVNQYVRGDYADKQQMLEDYVKVCSESLK